MLVVPLGRCIYLLIANEVKLWKYFKNVLSAGVVTYSMSSMYTKNVLKKIKVTTDQQFCAQKSY